MANSALTAKQRLKLLEKVFKGGLPVAKACRDFGVSRFTFYKWAKNYTPNAPRDVNLKSLRDRQRRIVNFRAQTPKEIEDQVKKIVVEDPTLSKYRIADILKSRVGEKAVGVHGVYNILKRSAMTTSQEREAWRQFIAEEGRRILTPEQRKQAIERVVVSGEPVAKVCKELGISRFTFYKWRNRWERQGRRDDALLDRKPQFDRRHLRVNPDQEKVILSVVVEFPDLSKYHLAQKVAEKVRVAVGIHGVYNVLLRNGLTRPQARLAYSQAYAPQIPSPVAWTDRVLSVFEQFVPSLAPAPPPWLLTISRFFVAFIVSAFLSTAVSYSLIWWVNFISSQVSQVAIGLSFAAVALFMGSVFFLYSLKYYITLAIVLSFSQEEGVANGYTNGNGNGKKRNLISWILGLAKNGNGNGPTSREATWGKPVGLEPNLEHVKLKRYPFISIHIPFYNERNVVERAIHASTNFDYPEDYEVILADDSTDETTDIIRNYQKSFGNLRTSRGDDYTLTECEVRPGVVLKHLHRTSRSGFKGGALRE